MVKNKVNGIVILLLAGIGWSAAAADTKGYRVRPPVNPLEYRALPGDPHFNGIKVGGVFHNEAWKQVTAREDGFSAFFPIMPEKRTHTIKPSSSGAAVNAVVYAVATDSARFSVTVMPAGQPVTADGSRAALEQGVAAIAGAGSAALSSTCTTAGNCDVMDFTLTDRRRHIKGRAILLNGRLCAAVVSADEKKMLGEGYVSLFINYFKPLEQAKP